MKKEAIEYFEQMQAQNISPDSVTFLNLLAACDDSQMVSEAQKYY